MGSNRFYISIVIHCLLIFAAAFLFFYFLHTRQQASTAFGIGIVALLLTLRLIYLVNRTNRILGNFLSYMHESDPSLHYSVRYVEKNFKGLNEALEKLILEFKENRIDLEVQAQYLETILDNVSTGILTFNKSGEIRTINQAASECLGCGPVHHLGELDQKHPGLSSTLLEMRTGEQLTETLKKGGGDTLLSIFVSQIKLKQETVHIVALNDITQQMEEQEILSWKKLIRVINHEIMNSMTPIITLSMAIHKKLSHGDQVKLPEQLSKVALQDAIQSASIIEERSSGLVQFIERYKKLTGLPPMKTERFPAGELIPKVEQLFREEFKEKGIRFLGPSKCNIELEADRQMLEQELINLVKNSVEALRNTEDPEIELSCYREGDTQVCLSVRDNGEGIPEDKLEQVFVPFFTTREEGSGIGLSLCRQIIRSHNGRTHIESVPGEGTRVVITL
ncbi:MAG: GHKL domain-containing protein [Bacteroidia bacterium]|nr:MAG: GHKL domain-containing protein [Bacteroidia bacterium]